MLSVLQTLRDRFWAISLAFGLALLATSMALWKLKTQCAPPRPTLRVSILTKTAMLGLLVEIRKRYSSEYLRLRREARRGRRMFPRGSEEYRHEVVQYHKEARELLRKVSQDVIRQWKLSESLVISSFSFYEEDEEIEEAQGKLGVAVNDTTIPGSLSVELVKDIYTYCHDRATLNTGESFEDYAVRSTELEDELWERFGFEAEEIEKAYSEYRRELSNLETQFKLHGCFSFNSSLEEEVSSPLYGD